MRPGVDAGGLADLLIAPLLGALVLAARGTRKDLEGYVTAVVRGLQLTRP